jgi:hypothetical protein
VEDISVSEDTWVDVHAMFGLRVEAKLVEMLARTPLKSSGGPIPINLVDDVVLQGPEANTGVSNGVMGEDQGLTMGEKVLARSVVADRVSLTLEIMVLAGSAVLPVVITPHDAPIPGILIKEGKITAANPKPSEFTPRDDGSPRQHLRGLREM